MYQLLFSNETFAERAAFATPKQLSNPTIPLSAKSNSKSFTFYILRIMITHNYINNTISYRFFQSIPSSFVLNGGFTFKVGIKTFLLCFV